MSRPSSLAPLCLCVCAALAAPALAEESEVCVDSFSAGGAASFQGGFVLGERAAVKFTVGSDPVTVRGARFLFGGAEELVTFPIVIAVFDDNGVDAFDDPGFPGTALMTETFQAVSTTTAANEHRFAGAPIITEGSYWLAVELRNSGLPSIARDDGLTAGKNALFSQGTWVDSGAFGLEGDWILHAIIDTATPPA
jgi:hypothetical protein